MYDFVDISLVDVFHSVEGWRTHRGYPYWVNQSLVDVSG
jgi:hypothetical protein